MTMRVARGVVETLIAEARRAHPLEACGLLLGGEAIEQAVVCRNVHPEPLRHFEIDPAALIAAYKAARGGCPALLGYWHSHPVGPPVPSQCDREMAGGDDRVWAIVAGEEVRFWRDAPRGFEALSYTLADV
jgi:proteasome lid subunit RPN8/RPN11